MTGSVFDFFFFICCLRCVSGFHLRNASAAHITSPSWCYNDHCFSWRDPNEDAEDAYFASCCFQSGHRWVRHSNSNIRCSAEFADNCREIRSTVLLVTLELSRNSRDVRVGVFFFLVNWGKNDLKIAFFTFWQKKKKKKKKKKGGGGEQWEEKEPQNRFCWFHTAQVHRCYCFSTLGSIFSECMSHSLLLCKEKNRAESRIGVKHRDTVTVSSLWARCFFNKLSRMTVI